MKKYIFLQFAIIAMLFGCSQSNDPSFDDKFDLINEAIIKEAIEIANGWRTTDPDIISYIDQILMTIKFPDGRKVTKNLPENETFVAIAPYINSTHTCSVHYFSSCQGEMFEMKIEVLVRNEEGDLEKSMDLITLKNGFFELWLPRNKKYEIEIIYENLIAKEWVSTFSVDNTCLTTFLLK